MPASNKRPKAPVVTVDVHKSTYDILASKAELRGLSTRKYVNEILLMNIEKDKFLSDYAPEFSYNGISDDGRSIFIRDQQLGKDVPVFRRDSRLYCEHHRAEDCEHIHFALALPEVARLDLKKPFKK